MAKKYLYRNPYIDLTDDELEESRCKHFDRQRKNFYEAESRLLEILRTTNPLFLLSAFSSSFLTQGIGDNTIIKPNEHYGITAAHVEIMQAYSLTLTEQEFIASTANLDAIEELAKVLVDLADSSLFVFPTSEDRDIGAIQFLVRSHTSLVRHYTYEHQIFSQAIDLYSGLDQHLKDSCGFTAQEIVTTAFSLQRFIGNKSNQLFKNMRELRKLTSTEEMIDGFLDAAFFIPPGRLDVELIKKESTGRTIDEVFARLWNESDIFKPYLYLFDADMLSTVTDIPIETVDSILKFYSFPPGALASADHAELVLSKPTNSRPIIRLGPGYFCATPYSLVGSLNTAIEMCVKNRQKLGEVRSKYLENKIYALLKSSFAEDVIYPSFHWDVYETDIIVVHGPFVFLIEAKSATFSDPGRRGGPSRIKTKIRELIIEPNIQSLRLQKKILGDEKNGTAPDIDIRKRLGINLDDEISVVRISVTLDDFATIPATIHNRNNSNIFPENYEACLTISVHDFETIISLLEDPVTILHYFCRRNEMQNSDLHVFGHELSFLGLYTDNNFDLAFNPEINNDVSSMSEIIDNYYELKNNNYDIEKPGPVKNDFFQRLHTILRENQTEASIYCLYNLCCISIEKQDALIKQLQKVYDHLNLKTDASENSIDTIGVRTGYYPNISIIVVVSNSTDKENIYDLANETFGDNGDASYCYLFFHTGNDLVPENASYGMVKPSQSR